MGDIVLLGPPGSGKGTQAARLAERGWVHLATGDLFRDQIRRKTRLGELARSYIDRGELVPDKVTVDIVRERIAEMPAGAPVVFDGFPRTIAQAEALDRLLAEWGRSLSRVVFVDVPRDVLLERIAGRVTCPSCQAVYNLATNPPRAPGRCDRCGSAIATIGRTDERPEVVAKRLDVFERETAPLVEHYRRRGLLRKLPGDASLEDVHRRVLEAVEVMDEHPSIGSRALGQPRMRGLVTLKTPEQIATMRRAGIVVAAVLRLLRDRLRPGVTTAELDAIAARELGRHGAVSSFKGYYGYPAVICTSVNEEIVHGIPARRPLREGDIVGIDAGAIVEGWHADAAITIPVGRVSPEAAELVRVAREALELGIAAARPGARLGDIGAAIQRHAEAHGYSVVRNYVGHGIGRAMHEEPQVPNFGEPERGLLIKEGLCLAIEPMLNAGSAETQVLEDRWTVVTADGSLSAHFEHTIAVGAGGPEVLTRE